MQNILIFEDFADTRTWLREILYAAFHNVDIAEAVTIKQVRDTLKQKNFDLALIDLNLPDGSGIDIIKEISSKMPTKVQAPTGASNDVHLSGREQEILTLEAKGFKRNEIGPMFGISPHTVTTHLKTIYSKLNVNSRAEATMEALRMG